MQNEEKAVAEEPADGIPFAGWGALPARSESLRQALRSLDGFHALFPDAAGSLPDLPQARSESRCEPAQEFLAQAPRFLRDGFEAARSMTDSKP